MLLAYMRAFKDGDLVRTIHHSGATWIRWQSGGKAAPGLGILNHAYFRRHKVRLDVNGLGRGNITRAMGKPLRGVSYIFVKHGNPYVITRNNIFISEGPTPATLAAKAKPRPCAYACLYP